MTHIYYANWCLSDNFGDKLTPYIVQALSENKCIYIDSSEDEVKYMVCGSILNWDVKNCYVWGAGIANKDDIIPYKNCIYATRGYISNEIAKNSGLSTYDIVGDPALLLPYIYKPRIRNLKYQISIIPHYVDYYKVKQLFGDKYNVINLLDSIETVIDEIYNSEKVISSSLHGLIVADAYNIPNKWVKFTDKILGDDTKYYDYYSTTDISDDKLDLSDSYNYDLEQINYTLKLFPIEKLKALLSVCPFYNKFYNKLNL